MSPSAPVTSAARAVSTAPGVRGDPANAAGGWDRRRLLMVLAAVAVTAAALLAGLVYAVYYAITSSSEPSSVTAPAAAAGAAGEGGAEGGQAHRDDVAAAPMLEVDPADGRPTALAAVAGPTITVPAATGTGPASVPTGFPRTPQGAVGQLAAIETTVLQAMAIPHANEVYRAWALPGGVGITGWEMTRNVQAFLEAARMGPEKDATTAVVATPAAAQVKGTDGEDWVLACVLLDVRATITTDALVGYGYCERMQWHQDRWRIAPGAPAAKAPSTWPGSDLSVQAGWRTWVDQGDVAGAG